MEHRRRLSLTSALSAIIIFVPLHNAPDAYLDPGTGSIFIQVIIGVAVGGLFGLKLYWNKVSAFVRNLFSRGKIRDSIDE